MVRLVVPAAAEPASQLRAGVPLGTAALWA